MANDDVLTVKVTVEDDTKKGTDSAKKNLKSVGDEAEKTAKKVENSVKKTNVSLSRNISALSEYLDTLNFKTLHNGENTKGVLDSISAGYNKVTDSLKNANTEAKSFVRLQQRISEINSKRKQVGTTLAYRSTYQGKFNEAFGMSSSQIHRRLSSRYRGDYGELLRLKYDDLQYNKNRDSAHQEQYNAKLAENYDIWARMFDQLEKDTSPKHIPSNLKQRMYEKLFKDVSKQEALMNLRERYSQPQQAPKLSRNAKQAMYEQLFAQLDNNRKQQLQNRFGSQISARNSQNYQNQQVFYQQLFSNGNMLKAYGLNGVIARLLPSSAMQKFNNFKSSKFATGAISKLQSLSPSLEPLKNAVPKLIQSLASATPTVAKFVGKFATGAIKGFGSALGGIAKDAINANKGLISLVRGTANLIKRFNNLKHSLTGNNLKLTELFKRFKNIAMYRLIRTVIHQIGLAFNEGLKNIYNWSALTGGELYQSINKIATSMLYLKNSIGAVLAPIINQLAPVIDMIVDRLVNVINIVNQLISKVTGASTWTKAIKQQTEWKDALDKSAKSAKNLTIGIDELNVINDSKDDTDYAGMFETQELAIEDFDWVDKLKDMFTEDNFAGLGQFFADALNGLIDNIPYADIGTKVAEKLNNAFALAYSFLSGTNWGGLGTGLGTTFNNFLEDINAELIGQTIGAKIRAGFDLAVGFIKTTDWDLLLQRIEEGFKGMFDELAIDTGAIGEGVGKTVNKINELFRKAIDDVPWADIGVNLGNGITAITENTDTEEAGNNIGTLWTDIITLLDNAVINSPWSDMGEKFSGFFRGIFEGFGWTDLGTFLSDSVTGIIDFADSAIQTFPWDEMSDGFATLIRSMIEDIPWGDIMKRFCNRTLYVFLKVREFLKKLPWKMFGAKIADMINNIPWYDLIMEVWKTTCTLLKGLFDVLNGLLETVEWKDKFYEICKALLNILFPAEDSEEGKLITDLKESLDKFVGNILKVASDLFLGLGEALGDKILEGMGIKFTDSKADKILSDFVDKIKKALDFAFDVDYRHDWLSTYTPTLASWLGVTPKANGGFVDSGQLFVAREAGAEMVGSIGSRTAVANNDQIVDGISIGVYDAVLQAMSQTKGNGSTSVNVYLDGKQITTAVENRQRQRGASIYSGGLIYEG